MAQKQGAFVLQAFFFYKFPFCYSLFGATEIFRALRATMCLHVSEKFFGFCDANVKEEM